MDLFSFGKKLKRHYRRTQKKPPTALLKKCRKHRIKTTMKKGGKRVYRKVSVLKKLLAKKMRKIKSHKKRKAVKKVKSHKKRKAVKRRGMGFGNITESQFLNPSNYGYNQPVQKFSQTLSQSSSVVNDKMNMARPEEMAVGAGDVPTYGVYRDFFGQDVPTQLPPNWNFMGQPDGSLYPVGAPFQRYTTPIATGFGKKKRYSVSGSPCNRLRKKVCRSNPNCSYTKRGCRRRSGTVKGGLVFEGPSLAAFGRRSRFGENVTASDPKDMTMDEKYLFIGKNIHNLNNECQEKKGKLSPIVCNGPLMKPLKFGRRSRFGSDNIVGRTQEDIDKIYMSSGKRIYDYGKQCQKRGGIELTKPTCNK